MQYTTDQAKLSNLARPLVPGYYRIGRLFVRILAIEGELVTYEYVNDAFGALRAYDNRVFMAEMITGESSEEEWLCAILSR